MVIDSDPCQRQLIEASECNQLAVVLCEWLLLWRRLAFIKHPVWPALGVTFEVQCHIVYADFSDIDLALKQWNDANLHAGEPCLQKVGLRSTRYIGDLDIGHIQGGPIRKLQLNRAVNGYIPAQGLPDSNFYSTAQITQVNLDTDKCQDQNSNNQDDKQPGDRLKKDLKITTHLIAPCTSGPCAKFSNYQPISKPYRKGL